MDTNNLAVQVAFALIHRGSKLYADIAPALSGFSGVNEDWFKLLQKELSQATKGRMSIRKASPDNFSFRIKGPGAYLELTDSDEGVVLGVSFGNYNTPIVYDNKYTRPSEVDLSDEKPETIEKNTNFSVVCQFLAERTLFVGLQSGRIIAIPEMTSRPYFLSDDSGKTFKELYRRGLNGSSTEYKASFENPHCDPTVQLVLKYKAPMLTVITGEDEEVFYQVAAVPFDQDAKLTIVSLPEIRVPEYLFKMQDGRVIYLDALKYNYSYETIRMFIGTLGDLKEVTITSFRRYRDGGTTHIMTDAGLLFSPTPFSDETSKLDDHVLAKVSRESYSVEYRDGKIDIKMK